VWESGPGEDLSALGLRTQFAGAAAAVGAMLLAAAPAAQAISFAQEGPMIGVGDAPDSLVAADLNGDGYPDLAVANGTSSNVYILLRQPGGGFAYEGLPISVGAGAGPSEMTAADFNGDGALDLAVSNFVAANVVILLRNGTNSGYVQEAGSPIALGDQTSAIAAGDFNGDTRQDLAVARWNAADVRILLRQAGGGFAAEAGSPATGTNPRSVAVGDFDGDTRPDLATTNNGAATVSVLLRQAGGGFAAEAGSPIPVGASPQAIRSADLDGDGRPDLALSNYTPSTETILLRQAGGGFAQESFSPITVDTGPVGVSPGDLDNDGLTDLVVSHQAADSALVLRRRAAGSFTFDPPDPIAAGDGASVAGIADFDSDGRRDFAVANQFVNGVSVFLNTTPAPDLGSAPPPPPGVPPDPVTGQLPPPTTAKTVNADKVSGTVLVKVPGSNRFVPLGEDERQIPMKSVVDARKGRVEIETAAGTAVRPTQQAVFYDGVFQLLQERKARDAIVEARLVGALENCPKRKGEASAAARSGRRLWGKGRGRFRSRGRRSSTTVRGTTWLVEDRCDGTTLNRVTEGKVLVRDFTLKEDISLKAPGSYVARPRARKR
jgi:FG-GAP-like repeat